jgi:hypothetical protein
MAKAKSWLSSWQPVAESGEMARKPVMTVWLGQLAWPIFNVISNVGSAIPAMKYGVTAAKA